MTAYLIRRLLLFIPALLGMSLIVFTLVRLVPGDYAELLVYQAAAVTEEVAEQQVAQIRRELGLDRPLAVQYLDWLGGVFQGDFGYSYVERRPVTAIIRERFPRTLELALMTLLIAVAVSLPLGILSAVKQDTWMDYLARVISIFGLSIPLFFSGILVLYILSTYFQWIPPLEFISIFDDPLENLKQVALPAAVQAFYIMAPIARLTRSQMLEVIREDYIRTARAKGLAERVVILRHALRNALIPVVTFVGWWGGRLLGTVTIIEVVFSIPGMGNLLINAVFNRDYPTVQAILFILAGTFLLINLVIDLLYAWLDPRIRYA